LRLSAAPPKSVRVSGLWCVLVCLLVLAPPLGAQQAPAPPSRPFIENIRFVGNQRFPRDTLLARIFSRAGDPYSDDALRRDFHALWNTGWFEDIRLEVESSPRNPSGRIITFYVKERPIIRRIRYVGNKSVSESDILDRFKDRKVGLSVESQFDPTKIKRAVVVLKELLAEHGRQFATIKPTYERIPASNAVILTFNIDEGPKVKVGKITITGNHAFSQRRIVRAMRHSRPYGVPLGLFFLPVMSKTFDRQKLAEDLEVGIRGLYQDHGYFRVLVKDPILKTVDVNRAGLPGPWPLVGHKHGKATNITIPVEEGSRYRMGKLVVRSADPEKGLFFKTDYLEKIFPLKPGDIFATDKIRKSLEDYRKLYGAWGFIDFTAEPLTEIDEAHKRINLTLEFDQQKQYYVRRIEFVGNTTTRDKVIRRELLLSEGDLFNSHLWELSILRLNQLDYFEQLKPENAADIKRNVKEGTVDLTLHVKEKGKQSIGLTGGISGLAGSFIGLSYQTNNFLGLGETLTFETDLGDRQTNFLFGFTEPYLLDRPISTGFTVFSSRFSYNQAQQTSLLLGQQVNLPANLAQNFDENRKGFTVFASYPLRRFSFTRLGVTYGWSTTDITAFSQASTVLFQALQFQSLAGPSALSGIVSSKITPTLTYNRLEGSPINPTGGKSIFVGLSFEGGPIGGNINTVSPTFEFKYFHPVNHKRNVLGFHLLGAFATGYSGRVLAPFNRFYIGGEDTVRGFDFFTISPWVFVPTLQTVQVTYFNPSSIGPNGQPLQQALNVPVLHNVATRPGGDSEIVGNAEYRIPLVGPVSMSLFYDVGLDGILRRNQLELNSAQLTNFQRDFPNSDFSNLKINQELPVASGTNFHLRSSTGIEFVVQLPIVNAPFRVYYAYNLNRLTETIVEPTGGYFLSDAIKASLPPGVLQTQIVPQLTTIIATQPQHIAGTLFEPSHAFRFTVSRTF
jgi:outer membrane protein insertion porin family